MEKEVYFLGILILILIAINYSWLDSKLTGFLIEEEFGIVERIVDGDTLIINGNSTRLLGINCPEKGQFYYEEAKNFLSELVLNKTVVLQREKEDLDKYNRKLRYIFLDGENINLKLVEEGLANYYFPQGKDRYYNYFTDAWKNCVFNNKNLCEKSKKGCSECIKIQEFDIKKQKLILENVCSFNCDLKNWTLKDEGRKIFVFPEFILTKEVMIFIGEGINTENILYWQGEEYVWTQTGDTLFLRDNDGKLILWESY